MANEKRSVWMFDANNFEFNENTPNLIQKTKTVKDFLECDSGSTLASTKGWGKTFLLKSKRILEENSSISMPFKKHVDKLSTEFELLDHTKIEYLHEKRNSIKIWEISIVTSIYKYLKDYYKSDLQNEVHKYFNVGDINHKKQIESFLSSIEYVNSACDIFTYLLQENKGRIEKILKAFGATIKSNYANINRPITYFIDSIDEAFNYCLTRDDEKDIWYNVQQGLIRAVYNLNTINPRIKIYIATRKEVLTGDFGGELSQQIRNNIVDLSYSMYDMKEMFQKYVSQENEENLVFPGIKYSDAQSAFFGFNTITYEDKQEIEEVFEYVYRHTFGRPRDFIQICKNVSTREPARRKELDTIKNVINESGYLISKDYFNTVKSFTDNFSNDDLENLFRLIRKNVLTKKDIIDICFEYNHKTCNKMCENLNGLQDKRLYNICRDKNGWSIKHPFCSLYNIGFLGIIKGKNPKEKIQSFRLPGESIENSILSLPDSENYLIHPALNRWIEEVQQSKGVQIENMYEINNERIIGYNKPWKESNKLSWLHLSNVHFKLTNSSPKEVQDQAIEYLDSRIKEQGDKKFDFAVVTGDIDYQNRGQQGPEVEFLKKIISRHLENKNNIFIVPGNHDLFRDNMRLQVLSGIKEDKSKNNFTNLRVEANVIKKLNNSFRKSNRGKGFTNVYKMIKEHEYPLDSQHFVENKDKFNIVHINTCIFSGLEKEEGSLLFDHNKLKEILTNEGVKDSRKLNIAIGHHNIEAFDESSKKNIYGIFNEFNIHMYLCGHDKNPNSSFDKHEIDKTCILTCAAGIKHDHSAAGMITGTLDIENYKGNVMFHKWSTDTENWVTDNEARRDASKGILPISIKKV